MPVFRGQGGVQIALQRFDQGNRAFVGGFESPVLVGHDVGDDAQAVLQVIEDHEGLVDPEVEVGKPVVVPSLFGDVFHQPDGVVGEESHRAAREGGQIRIFHAAEAAQEGSEFRQGVALEGFGLLARNFNAAAAGAKDVQRIAAEEGIAREFLADFHAFQQEGARAGFAQFEQGRDGRFQIRQKIPDQGDDIPLFRLETDGFERLNHGWKNSAKTCPLIIV